MNYRSLFDQSADAIVVFDPKTLAMLRFNDEACRRLGYSRKEFAKLKLSDFEVIESAEELKRHARKIPTNQIKVFETKQRTKQGVLLDVEIRTRAVCIGGKRLIQGVWRDITRHKRAEEALRKSKEQTERILNDITDLFVSLDRKHRYTNLNARAETYLGVKKEEVLGKQPWEVFPQVKNGLFHKLYMKAVAAQTPIHAAPILSGVTGRWYESHFFPSADGVSIYYKDVTERMQAEEALRQANEQLESRVRERTSKLRALAAELTRAEHKERRRIADFLHEQHQQNLCAMKFRASELRQRSSDPAVIGLADRLMAGLDHAIDETRTLATALYPQVLTHLGLKAGIEWLADDAMNNLGLDVKAGIDKRFTLASDEMQMFVFDAVRELLLNVVKHAKVNKAEVRVSSAARGMVRIQVKDAGVGFNNMRNNGAPTHLGLFKIQERAESFGGRFEVVSQPEKGTCVSIILPSH